MKALLQRVRHASVSVGNNEIARIDRGLLVFLGVHKQDNEACATRLAQKVLGYRIFADAEDKMNLNVQQAEGGLLLVSQFTLVADTNSGTRASFTPAAEPQIAQKLYDYFNAQLSQQYPQVQSGEFAADMQVSLINDGPVTFLLDVS